MTPSIGDLFSGLQQAAANAKQARDARARDKTDDGRRIYRIACLGHANSGKTTFWTVLEGATREFSDKFNLQTGDNTTAAYLMRQREVMQQGVLTSPEGDEKSGEVPGVYEPGYPEKTDLVANLVFMARQPGRAEFPMQVQDYPGGSVAVEDLEGGSASVAEFVKSADGVLFFIDGIVTRLSRVAIDQQLAAFRSILRQIEDSRGKIHKPVGVVFTKADTLPGYRRGVPVALLQSSDLRRRQEPFGKFLEQLLRSGPYAQDPAWQDRVNKTMSRVQSFADMLLKKCDSPQFFFVSAVGHKRRRPVEASRDMDGSLVSSRIGAGPGNSFVVGKHQAGLEAPIAWLANELAVMSVVNRARRIRNRALTFAAVWCSVVSLVFGGYMGCMTNKITSDFRAKEVPARMLLHDVRAFEEHPIARLWEVFDKYGHMATARSGRSGVASLVQQKAEQALRSILTEAGGSARPSSQELTAKCEQWVVALEDCAAALPDTSLEVKYRDAALKIRCLSRFYGDLGRAFSLSTTDAQRAAIDALRTSRLYQGCITEEVKSSLSAVISSVLNAAINPATLNLEGGAPATITATVGGGTPPYKRTWTGPEGTGPFGDTPSIIVTRPGNYTLRVTDDAGNQTEAVCAVTGPLTLLKDRYNSVLQKYGSLVAPEARLNRALIEELRAMQSEGPQADALSQEAANRIFRFLQKAKPFVDGVDVKILILSLSTPARLKVDGDLQGAAYIPNDTVVLQNWRIGKKVLFNVVMSNQQVPLPIDDLVGSQNKSIQVAELKAQGGGGVALQYKIVEPRVDDENIPLLEPVP